MFYIDRRFQSIYVHSCIRHKTRCHLCGWRPNSTRIKHPTNAEATLTQSGQNQKS
jgi:hypothetical protein